ncbi:dephospho-CoA kinase [Paludibacter sp. 221]|uniref:dephospho-CoA kinase n=1 Tax=Paludibacter sp. 221 TaxID=2302939 RepID=UPI0013D0BF4A|nr:dephospho-CoA kinase [Paludibacter sp. 221]NDV46016.1 dephospho-CoA kinase [Paludibacter sp. 221]
MKKPLVIGITGGIGGGKSTLARMLQKKGYHVYDTDVEAKKLQDKNTEIRRQLIELFGDEIYDNDRLNRKKLASIVFRNPEQLAKLNEIVHPVVREHFLDWKSQHSNEKYLFVESAIMYESGFVGFVDKVIVVTAPLHVRILRVAKRDKITPEQVRERIARQLPEEEKIKKADIVLNSDGKDVLSANVEHIFSELSKIEATLK